MNGLDSFSRMDRRAFLVRSTAGVSLVTVGGLSACMGEDAKPAAKAKATPPAAPTGTLGVANPGEPNFLDPSQALELTEWSINRNVYDGLMEFDRDYKKLVPALAETWESNADATAWTFKLREGVVFHDGTPFDSSAAKATLEYYRDKTWGFTVADLERVDDSDPAILRVVFSKPSPDFARNQTIVRMISPKLIAEDAAGERAVGTGPYKFVQWDKGRAVILEANTDFWGNGPHFERVELRTIGDQTAAITALTSGNVDLVMKAPPKQLERLGSDSKYQAFTKDSWLEGHLIMKASLKPTDNVKVRQAIAYAIDREAIVKSVLLDQAVVATSPMPPQTYGQVDAATSYSRDPEKARALLSEAGFPEGVAIKMAVWAGIRVSGEEVTQAIAAQLEESGISVDLDILEPGVGTKDLVAEKGKYHIHHAEYGWANGGPLHFTLGTALGHAQYTGKELTDLVEQMKSTPDSTARLKIIAEAQDLFMQELPHFPLYHLRLTDLATEGLAGYTNPKDGYFPVFQQAFTRT